VGERVQGRMRLVLYGLLLVPLTWMSRLGLLIGIGIIVHDLIGDSRVVSIRYVSLWSFSDILGDFASALPIQEGVLSQVESVRMDRQDAQNEFHSWRFGPRKSPRDRHPVLSNATHYTQTVLDQPFYPINAFWQHLTAPSRLVRYQVDTFIAVARIGTI
jgi:hypothetical protein